MKNINKILTINLVVVSLTACLPAQPASAQILELATGALGIVNSIFGKSDSQPTPQPVAPVIIPQPSTSPSLIPDMKVGAGNFNGNTLNLCVSGCLPSGNVTQAIPPRINTFPPVPIAQPTPQVIPSGNVAQPIPQTIPSGVNNLSSGTIVQPGTPVTSQPVPTNPNSLW